MIKLDLISKAFIPTYKVNFILHDLRNNICNKFGCPLLDLFCINHIIYK